MTDIIIKLDAERFQHLVSGKVLEITFPHSEVAIQIALDDIGYDKMNEIVQVKYYRHFDKEQ